MAKYSKEAGKKVEEALHEMHNGELKSGRSNKKVTSRKQAIAIGLSEAREKGAKCLLKNLQAKPHLPERKALVRRRLQKRRRLKRAIKKTGCKGKQSCVGTM